VTPHPPSEAAGPAVGPDEAIDQTGTLGAATTPPPEDRPRLSTAVEEGIAAIALALVCLITFANVLVRYFTSASFAFTEEFSVFLLVVLTLAGASAAFARNRHIRMEFFVARLGPAGRRRVEVLVMLCALALFAVLAFYGTYLFLDDYQYGTTSPGIGVPQWIYTVWLPVFSAVITLRILGRLARLVLFRFR
jgi:TRAP-type C4-dicarboxylate transport system permease small subunit